MPFILKFVWVAMMVAIVSFPSLWSESKKGNKHLSGRLYEIDSERNMVLYDWEMKQDNHSGLWHSTYKSPGGRVVAKDEVVWEHGEIKRYSYVRYTTNEISQVERQGDKLIYTQILDGKRKQSIKKYEKNYTAGPAVITFIQENWNAFVAGERLTIRYGVLDRLTSFGFELQRDPGHPQDQSDKVVVRMMASGLLIRLAISPIYFVFHKDRKVLLELIGRSLPVRIENGSMRPVDGELVIEGRTDY